MVVVVGGREAGAEEKELLEIDRQTKWADLKLGLGVVLLLSYEQVLRHVLSSYVRKPDKHYSRRGEKRQG